MKRISVIGATLLGAAVLCAAPISLHLSHLSVDKAQARIGRLGHGGYYGPSHAAAPPGTSCKAAAKLEFPTDRKARHTYSRACKLAWKAQKKAA